MKISFAYTRALAISAVFCAVAAANAATVIVTPADPSWTSGTENTGANSSTTISTTAPRSGDGSLELRGNRTRYFTGNFYNPASNLSLLDQVLSLTYQWRIAGDSTNSYHPDYTPALRLHIFDGAQRSELIWEGVYNNLYGSTMRDTWYQSGVDDLFYQFVAGSGVTLAGGSQVNMNLADWINSSYFSANAYVSAISVGHGSGTGAGYHAFVDNVTFATSAGSTTYNFETAAVAEVPEPGTLALLGIGIVGVAALRRRKV